MPPVDEITLASSRGPKEVRIVPEVASMLARHRHHIEIVSSLVVIQFFTLIVGFITQIKIANTLGKEVFGQLAFGLALGACGQVVIRFGLDRTLVRDLIHDPEHTAKIVRASLVLRYSITALVVSALLLWKMVFSASDAGWGLMFIVIGNSILSLDLQPVYDAWQKIRRHAVYYLIQRGIYFGVVWLTIFLFPGELTIHWLGLATLGTVLMYLFLQHRWAMRQLPPVPVGKKLFGEVFDLARRNLWVWFAALSGLFLVQFNQLILKRYMGYAELGSYAAGWQIVMVGMLFLEQVARIGRPATARHTRPEVPSGVRKRFLVKYSIVMLAAVLPIVLIMTCFPGLIYKYVYTQEYATGSNILPVFGIYLLVVSLGMVSSQYILAIKKEFMYLVSVVVGGVISIFFCGYLIPNMGQGGAAWAVLLSHGTSILIYSAVMVHDVGNRSKQHIPAALGIRGHAPGK
jgi:O-antigen/teichoic acid export membrane protein